MTGERPKTSRKQWAIASAAIAILLVAVAAIVVYNRRAEREMAAGLYVPHDAKLTPELLLLRQYIQIDTSNPPGNESAGARWLADQLHRGGVQAEIIESAPRRANVYARIKGRERGKGLLLLSHIDVVPAHGKWSKPAFSGDTAANMIYGRGAADMKGIAIADLRAFLDVAQSGRAPEHDLVFLAVADEEAGGAFGTQWLLEHRADVFSDISYVLAEGGITEVQKERPTFFGIEIGAKEITDLTLGAATREELQRARIALEPFFRRADADKVLPGVRAYFRSIAPHRIEFESLLSDIDKTIANGRLWLLPITYRDLVQNTLWAGAITPEGDRFAMRVALANLPEEDPVKRIEWLRSLVRPYGATVVRIERQEGPTPISPIDTPLFALLAREIQRGYGTVPVGPQVLAASTSDSRFLRPRGIVCYGFQPFPLDFFQTQGIHGVDERVRLDWFTVGVEVTRHAVAAYAFDR